MPKLHVRSNDPCWYGGLLPWLLTSVSVLVHAPPVAGQLHDIDSLHALLKERPVEDSLTANTLYQLGRSYWIRDLDSAASVSARLLSMAERIGYRKGVADAWNSIGVVHWYKGEYLKAMEAHQRALSIRTALGRPQLIAASYHNIGLLHDDQGNYPEAITNYLDALALYEQIDDRDGAAQEHNAIATVMVYQGDLVHALEEYRKALDLRRAAGDHWDLSESYSNLGLVHAEMGQLDSAAHYHGLALKLREQIDDQQGIAVSNNNLGDLLMLLGRHAEALACFRRALEINTRLGYRKSLAYTHLNLGRLWSTMGQRDRAVPHMKSALELAEEVGSQDLAHTVLKSLSETAAQMGRFADAYGYRLRYEALTDTLYNAERTRSLVRQQMEHAFAKQQLADSLAAAEALERSRMDHALQLAAERNHRTVVTLGGVLLLLAALGLWSRLRYVRRARDTILRTQERLLISEKRREAEQVRTHIARDIHDEIGGELTRIRLMGNEVHHLMASDQKAASSTIERMARSAQEATGALRDIVWATDPARDSVQGLVDHLREISHRQLEGSGIQATLRLEHQGTDQALDPAWRTAVLRIVKEALNNVVKYSGAKNVTLVFRSDTQGFELSIHDDGRGFDPGLATDGNGLRNMRSRAQALGADLSLSSGPGAGCTITVMGPAPASARSG